MERRYQTYPEYKDSGVEWLGEIPKHWNVGAMKRVCRLVTGLTPPTSNQDYYADQETEFPWVRPEDISSDLRFDNARKFLTQNGWEVSRVVPSGSSLICCIGTIGKVGLTKRKVVTNQQITAAIFRYAPSYNFYAIIAAKKELEETATGNVLKILNSERLGDIKMPLPPDSEAEIIANFLDHETAKIDTLIEKQQQLIALLKEKRQAVISHAVTKGLNPDAPMKDSGVEWLGEVPAHWKVTCLKYLVAQGSGIQMGPFGGMLKDLEPEETEYKLYGQENTISGDFTKGGRWISKRRYDELSNYRLEVGDIVLTRKGSLGKARLICKLPTAGIMDSDTIRVKVDDALLSSDYLGLLMHEAQYITEQILRTRRGSILPGLNTETIANLKILLPISLDEQQTLVNQIKDHIKYYSSMIEKCNRKCDLLQERRTALISAAVTGKIDVRNWQPPTDKDIQ
jgi:type I restriction enzyme S subunit